MKALQQEFLRMLSSYQGIIHKVNLVYFKTAADREDNFQEVVFQLWKSYSSLKNREKIASWIYAVAINTSISKLRKRDTLVLMDTMPESMHRVEEPQVERDMNIRQLLEAMQRINEIDRSILLLYMEDYSYKEIAEIIGISSVNVGVRINRAKKELKRYLIEE